MTNETTRGTPQQDEQRFRDIGERLVRSTDPDEQNRLKAELVRAILRGQVSRQQHALRDWATTCARPENVCSVAAAR
jgi:hypothetical protein